jgi:hypothetical protein
MKDKIRNKIGLIVCLILFYGFFGAVIIGTYLGCLVFKTCKSPFPPPTSPMSPEEIEFFSWLQIIIYVVVLVVLHLLFLYWVKKDKKKPIEKRALEVFILNYKLRDLISNYRDIHKIKDIETLSVIISTFSVRDLKILKEQLKEKKEIMELLCALNPDLKDALLDV